MNLKKIKEKIEALNSQKGGKFNEFIWRPTLGEHKVRIVPAKWDKEYPFKELYFHYGIGNKTMLSLINFGEKDPICLFAEEIKKGEYDPERWKLSKKLEPKLRVFAPIIVRGEEDKGVRLWGFGKEIYNELLALANDEDIGDFSDVMEGRDLTVSITKVEGKTFNNTSVRPRTKSTPLSEDSKQVKEWLSNQPDPLSVFDRVEYSELKQALHNMLSVEDSQEEDEEEATPSKELLTKGKVSSKKELESDIKADDDDDASPFVEPKKAKSYTLSNASKKANIDSQLKALFNEK